MQSFWTISFPSSFIPRKKGKKKMPPPPPNCFATHKKMRWLVKQIMYLGGFL